MAPVPTAYECVCAPESVTRPSNQLSVLFILCACLFAVSALNWSLNGGDVDAATSDRARPVEIACPHCSRIHTIDYSQVYAAQYHRVTFHDYFSSMCAVSFLAGVDLCVCVSLFPLRRELVGRGEGFILCSVWLAGPVLSRQPCEYPYKCHLLCLPLTCLIYHSCDRYR